MICADLAANDLRWFPANGRKSQLETGGVDWAFLLRSHSAQRRAAIQDGSGATLPTAKLQCSHQKRWKHSMMLPDNHPPHHTNLPGRTFGEWGIFDRVIESRKKISCENISQLWPQSLTMPLSQSYNPLIRKEEKNTKFRPWCMKFDKCYLSFVIFRLKLFTTSKLFVFNFYYKHFNHLWPF